MDPGPARLTVILQTGHVGAEERSKLSAAVNTGTLVTDLVVKNVRLHLNLHIISQSQTPFHNKQEHVLSCLSLLSFMEMVK